MIENRTNHMNKLTITNNRTIEYFASKIRNIQNFRFLRFGDGEMLCAVGEKRNIGKTEHTVFKEVTEDIRYILSNLNDKHINALQPLVVREAKQNGWDKYLPHRDWVNSDVFHKASQKGELYPFIEALKSRFVVIVSCHKTRNIPIHYNGFIEIRDTNSYLDKNYVIEAMDEFPPDTVFLFSASRLSVPVIYHSKRHDCTMIDLGSLWEPYIGNQTRSYHKSMTEEIINRNLGI